MSYTDHRLHHYLCFDIACTCIREKIAHALSTLWPKAKPRTLEMNGIGLSQEPFLSHHCLQFWTNTRDVASISPSCTTAMHRSQCQPPSQRSRTHRGRSRSPPRSRTPSRRRQRHHSRSRSPRPRQLTNRAPQQDGNSQWEDHRRLLDHWRADRDFLDSNMVYGLALPRKVISTSASRTLGIDQTPIHEIRLIQLMQEGSYAWCLRNLAAGKACYLEMFRSRQEAFFSCSLHRFLKDNRIDFNQLLQEIAIKEDIPSDLTVWENRKQASTKLVENVGRHMVGLVQQTPSSEVIGRIRKLEQENAELRASQADPSMHLPVHPEDSQPAEPPMDERGIATPVRRERDMPPPLHSPLSHSAPKTLTPTPPSKPVQKTLLFGKSLPTAAEQLDNLRCQGSPMYLERDGPKGATIQSVNAWMKTKILDATIHAKLDNAATSLLQQMQQAPLGQLPSVTRFLCEWGMEPGPAAKYKDKEATKLLLILDELRK